MKIGNIVRIKKNICDMDCYVHYMEPYCGKVATIVEILEGLIKLDIDNGEWWWKEEMFELIFSKIESLMTQMGQGVKEGEFAPNPTDGINVNACKYCDYANVCYVSSKKHKKAEKLSKEEIKEILKGGENNGI